MKKSLKITGLVAILIIIIFLVLFILFKVNFKNMQTKIENHYAQITDIDLTKINDGKYNGKFTTFLSSVDLEVEIKDHSITNINIVKQKSGKGYEGRAVIDRILENQSLKIDASTGATGSSKCIIIAVDKALKGQ